MQSTSREERDIPSWRTARCARRLNKAYDAAHAADPDATKIWLTEMGWSTCGVVSDPSHACFSDTRQAEYLSAAYNALDTQYPYVETAVWAFFRDPRVASDWDSDLGVLGRDFQQEPAYEAMRAYGTVR